MYATPPNDELRTSKRSLAPKLTYLPAKHALPWHNIIQTASCACAVQDYISFNYFIFFAQHKLIDFFLNINIYFILRKQTLHELSKKE